MPVTVNPTSPPAPSPAPAGVMLTPVRLPARQNSLLAAQAILNALYDARLAIAAHGMVSMTVDGQMTTFQSPSQLESAIRFWQREVALLSGRRRRLRTIDLTRF